MSDAVSIIDLLANGLIAAGLWAAMWQLDRRLIRLEALISHRNKRAEKETD